MIVPGSVNPLMMSGGDPLDELGVIARSLRVRRSATAYLTRTPGSNGTRTTQVLRAFIKRGEIGQEFYLFSAGDNTASPTQTFARFAAGNALEILHSINNVVQWRLVSTGLFRDPIADLDVVVAIDTTQSTAANRVLVGVNGQQITAFSTATYPTQNSNTCWSDSAYQNVIGRNSGISFAYSDGYYAHHTLIDGYPSGITSGTWGWSAVAALFGQTHPLTGQWRPKGKAAIKALADAGGINSHFLPFDDPTNTTTLCADASSKGNNWTANNISLTAGATYDSMLDTPTNNFCTLNPLLPINIASFGYYGILPTDGNLKMTGSSAPAGNYQNGTQQIKIKTYYEMLVGVLGAGSIYIGIQNVATGAIYTYQQDGQKNLAGSISAYGATFTAIDRVAVAVDPVSRSLEFFKQTGGTGAFVSQGVISTAFPAGDYVPFFYASNGTVLTVNFGQQGFSNSSLPSGAQALNTKNLMRPAVPNASKAFAAVTDTGVNILSTLSAAESWSSYIRIVKRRDSAEGWRWMFSDDPTNYMDSSSTAAKAAIPSFSGSSYSGYSLKVSAANGVAMGRLTHTNGVADTVTDNLGNARKAIILKNEATGSWFLYHPDLTAGKLLYLEQSTAETTDATLGTVLSNSFVVAAALASGTYRWIAFAELDGFLKLFSYTANNSTDGTYSPQGLTAAFSFLKRSSIGGSGKVYDLARSPSNPVSLGLAFDSTAGDFSVAALDDVSGGLKLRISGQDPNATGTEIGISFAAFPFRYANAR